MKSPHKEIKRHTSCNKMERRHTWKSRNAHDTRKGGCTSNKEIALGRYIPYTESQQYQEIVRCTSCTEIEERRTSYKTNRPKIDAYNARKSRDAWLAKKSEKDAGHTKKLKKVALHTKKSKKDARHTRKSPQNRRI